MIRRIDSYLCLALTALVGCAAPPTTDAQYQAQVAQGMHDALQADLTALVEAAHDLQNAAPADHGWDQHDPAWPAMNDAWIRARHAYEHVEGATAPIFPEIDITLDGRIEDAAPPAVPVTGDPDLFDDQGFTGLHAIERILYTAQAPARVVTYEQSLAYYQRAAYPATAAQAHAFKTLLCQKLVDDASALLAGWTPSHIDIGSAYQGLISLMNEQREKVTKAGSGQEESRYSQRTMDDLRFNREGTADIYALFRPWILARDGGAALDAQIEAGFGHLADVYSQYPGVAFPQPPATWRDLDPSPADLATPFGQLYTTVLSAVQPDTQGSVVNAMNAAATALGLPTFTDP